MRKLATFILLLSILSLKAQYYEPFTYTNGTTSTSEWDADCSACTLGSGDYFEVRSNELLARDVDGVAVFETEWIDLTTYSPPFTLYLKALKYGDMEGVNTPQSIHHDWMDVEYALDGGSYTDIPDFLNRALSDSTFYGEDGSPYDTGNDDEWSGQNFQGLWVNNIYADSIRIRVSMYNTANTERWGIDDLTVWEESLLPVELAGFEVEAEPYQNTLRWITLSEINNKGFTIQRSEDAIFWENIGWVTGSGQSNSTKNWYFYDPKFKESNYYRLEQQDFDGQTSYSEIVYVQRDVEKYLLFDLQGRRIQTIDNQGYYVVVNPVTGVGELRYFHP